MAKYFMSDIHGEYEALLKGLSVVEDKDNSQVYFLGDYIDRGNFGIDVPYKIMELCKAEPDTYFALTGNHDKMFLDFLDKGDTLWVLNDHNSKTLKSLLVGTEFENKKVNVFPGGLIDQDYKLITGKVIEAILENHSELIEWYRTLPYFIELEQQILVHAGLDFTLEDWRETPENEMIWLYPPRYVKNNTGKQLVVGHVQAYEFLGREFGYGIYHLEETDTYYIDGSTPYTKAVNVLKYENGEYIFIDQVGRNTDNDSLWCWNYRDGTFGNDCSHIRL